MPKWMDSRIFEANLDACKIVCGSREWFADCTSGAKTPAAGGNERISMVGAHDSGIHAGGDCWVRWWWRRWRYSTNPDPTCGPVRCVGRHVDGDQYPAGIGNRNLGGGTRT